MSKKMVDDSVLSGVKDSKNLAKLAMIVLVDEVEKHSSDNPKDLLNHIHALKLEFLGVRPTEIILRNALEFCTFELDHIKSITHLSKTVLDRVNHVLEYLETAEDTIVDIAQSKIKNGSVVFIHSFSHTVIKILLEAKKRKKRFTVRNVESRPYLEGRNIAKLLANHGIPVQHYIDLAGRVALKDSDIMLIGAKAIGDKKIISRIGCESYLELAPKYHVSSYVCAHSWKFDSLSVHDYHELIESGHSDEVWGDAPKNVQVMNFAFERIDPKLVTGIISDLGVHTHHNFVELLKKRYPFMF